MFEMVYPFCLRYPNSVTFWIAIFTRSRINSFASPLELCIPDGNIIFQISSVTLQHDFISKFEKLWLVTPKLSNGGLVIRI